MTYMKIPDAKEPEKYTAVEFTDEVFIEVKDSDSIVVDMQYPKLNMDNAVSECYVRETVYEKLKMAAGLLPTGYRLKIWDAWRPFLLQKELYEKYSEKITADLNLEKKTKEEREAVIAGFVSPPEEDEDVPPVHTTGAAVDVTIIDPLGRELDMGTGFDSFSEATATSWYENTADEKVARNRRLLYNAMTKAGFTNLPSEWWHYDYKDRFWAFYKNKPAVYKGVFSKEELNS